MATIDNLVIEVTANADAAAAALNRTASSANRLRGAAQGAGGGMRDLSAGAKDAGTATQEAGQQAGNAEKHTRNYGRAAEEAGKAAKRGASGVNVFWQKLKSISVSGLKGLGELPLFFGKRLTDKIQNASAKVFDFFKQIKRVAMYRLIRTILKEITQGITDGIKNLYNWSKAVDGTFAGSMDRIKTATQYLGNSFAAMVSPLINALSPAIDFIADKFVDLFNTINQIFAKLAGQTSYTAAKKVAAQWQDASDSAASSASDAVDKIKRTILGFDEINKLNGATPAGSGGGSGGNGNGNSASNMFETRAIEGGVGSFVDALKQAFSEDKWEDFGNLLGGKVNEIINSIDFAGIGAKVGEFINDWFSFKYWTLSGINFTNIGTKIAEFLNNAIANIDFELLGREIVKEFTIIGDMIIGFFTTFDWGKAADSLSKFAQGIFNELSKWLEGIEWSKVGKSIVDSIVAFFENGDFSGLTSSMSEFAGALTGAIVSLLAGIGVSLWETIVDGFNSAKEMFAAKIEECGGNVVLGILAGIIEGLTNIGVWIVNNIFKPFIKGFKDAFGISSPATTMEEPGKNIVLGIFEGIKNALKNINTWVKENIFDPIWNAIKNAGATVVTITVSLAKKIGEWAEDVWDFLVAGAETIVKTVQAVGEGIATFATNVWLWIRNGAETVAKTVEAIGEGIATFATNAWLWIRGGAETIVKTVQAIGEGIAAFATSVWMWIRDGAETIIKTVAANGEGIASFATSAWMWIRNGAETVVKTVSAAMNTALSWVDGIMDFFMGPDSFTKNAKIVTVIDDAIKSIIEFLKDPVTAIKKITIDLGFGGDNEPLQVVAELVDENGHKIDSFYNLLSERIPFYDDSIGLKVNVGVTPGTGFKQSLAADGKMSLAGVEGATATVAAGAGAGFTGRNSDGKLKLSGVVGAAASIAASGGSGFNKALSNGMLKLSGVEGATATVAAGAGTGFKSRGKDGKFNLTGINDAAAKINATVNGKEALKVLDDKNYVKTVELSLSLQGSAGGYDDGFVNAGIGSLTDVDEVASVTSFLNKVSGMKATTQRTVNVKTVFTSDSSSAAKQVFNSNYKEKEVKTKLSLDEKNSNSNALKAFKGSTVSGSMKLSLTWDNSLKNFAKALADATKGYLNIPKSARGGVFQNGVWSSIPQYAGGTANAHGSLFLAGEAGPELVGHLGGRTEVLNRSQLAATMFSAVRAAMNGVKIAAQFYAGGTGSGEDDYETMYSAMYDAFTAALAGSAERDREKVALLRQISAKDTTVEVTANSINRANQRVNRRAGTTIVPVGV